MERKIDQTCLDPAIDSLERVYSYLEFLSEGQLVSSMEKMKVEFKFLKMFFWGLSYWEDMEYDWHLRFAFDTIMPKFSHLATEFEADCRRALYIPGFNQMIMDIYDQIKEVEVDCRSCEQDPGRKMNWEAVTYDMVEVMEAIQQFKPQIKEVCIHLLGGTLKCTSTPSNYKKFHEYERDTAGVIDLILQNLRDLQNSNMIVPVMKQQIALVQRGLEKFGMVVDAPNMLFDIIPHTRAWLNYVSCLAYLYWIDGNDESLTSSMETILHVLLHKTLPQTTSGVISSHLQPTMIPQLLAGYLDYLLEGLVLPMKDYIETLQEGLIFMLSYILSPPDDDLEDREMIWPQIYAVINKFPSLIHSIRRDGVKGGIQEAKFNSFMVKVDGVKDKARKLFLVVPYSSQFPSPNTNVMDFLDVLIVNLRSMLDMDVNLILGLKHLCESLWAELVSFQPLLQNMMELLHDDEHQEILGLWGEIGNMVYNADYLTKLCFLRRLSTWYGMIALPYGIERIKFIKNEINKLVVVGVEKMYKEKPSLHDQPGENDTLQQQGASSAYETVSIGFREVEGQIINELTRGQMSLTIISVSGSGGQGKTTLAKRIYDDPNVQCHFHKSVWCYVSKDCSVKKLLVHMLNCNTKGVGAASELEMHDLIVSVWRSLKGKRFLIVMDDIWDTDAWGQLQSSFPDEKNGSRILFTSRNHDVASQIKSNSISHPLPLFSDEECWQLMKKKVFGPNDCDKEFVGIGKKIASFCKGLPLAVALIGGVLKRTKYNLDSWNKVAKNLKTHLAQEGCGNVVELSYKYLPDHLKSCFLYFAAFDRGEKVDAKRLKLFWVGEGFASHGEGAMCSEEDLATMYLKDLVSQSLVVVTERSSMGGIKRCTIHDLLYDLCLEKTIEDNFLHWADKSSVIGDDECNIYSSRLLKYNHHRLLIGKSDPFIKPIPIITKRGLPTSPLHTFLCLTNISYIDREFYPLMNYKEEITNDPYLQFPACFKVLSVLSLKGIHGDAFPEVILSIIHLRYLKLSSDKTIRAMPPTIANLRKLGTLIMNSCNLWDTLLPLSMWDMKSLRRVDIFHAILDLEGFDLKNSSNSNIETLGSLYFDKDDSRIAEIFRRFPNLRKLKCEALKGERHILGLLSMVGSQLTRLESLSCYIGLNGTDLNEENPNPIVWNFATVENLTKLNLDGTYLPWSVLSKIGKQLPNLHVLKLLKSACVGCIWELEDGDFSKLIYLKLSTSSIEEFDISNCDDPLPSLEHLVLDRCWELLEIPPVLGEINTLNTITVKGGSEKVRASAMRILEEQREFGNNSLQVIIEK